MGCDCDRYIEVWNNVFTQFDNDGKGHYTELEQKNIDTGMGLERLAAVVQEVDSIFDVDTIRALRGRVCEISGKEYKAEYKWDVSIRIVTDHIRSATFMISDGIMPSNEGRGYVLRRIIRRAARHGRLLGIEGSFLSDLSSTVIEGSKDGYPELEEKKDFIFNVLTQEESKFNRTIDQGLSILNELEDTMVKEGRTCLGGGMLSSFTTLTVSRSTLPWKFSGKKGLRWMRKALRLPCRSRRKRQGRPARSPIIWGLT